MPVFYNRTISPRVVLIIFLEGVIIFASTLGLALLRAYIEGSTVPPIEHFLKNLVLTVSYLVFFLYFRLYSHEFYHPGRVMFTRLVWATMAASVVIFSILYLVPYLRTWRTIIFVNVPVVPLLIIAWRSLGSAVLNLGLPVEKALIIGSGEVARKIGFEIFGNRNYGIQLAGFIDDRTAEYVTSDVAPHVIGGYGDIGRLVDKEGIGRIIIALSDRRAKLPMFVLLHCKLRGVTVEEGETFNERMTGQIPVGDLKPSWLIFSSGFKSLRFKQALKGVFDRGLSFCLLVFLSPLFPLIAILIKIDSRGPVFYSQVRVGKEGRRFNILKFRSLRDNAEASEGPTWASPNDERCTRLGRWLRKTCIDELPQLINIFRGEMSFVGPRPERPFFVKELVDKIPYYEVRAIVKPGLTGWAQVNQPSSSSLEDASTKLQYDMYYIKNMSLLLDMWIILATFRVVLTGKGALHRIV
ncbi:MAG: sugar transferase [Thermodesulfobacteriota bacterium]